MAKAAKGDAKPAKVSKGDKAAKVDKKAKKETKAVPTAAEIMAKKVVEVGVLLSLLPM